MNDGVLTPDKPYEHKVFCGVCFAELQNKGQTQRPAGPLGYSKTLVDCFWYQCPSYKEEWHEHCRLLKKEQKDTQSILIRKLLEMEIEFTIQKKKVPFLAYGELELTKEVADINQLLKLMHILSRAFGVMA